METEEVGDFGVAAHCGLALRGSRLGDVWIDLCPEAGIEGMNGLEGRSVLGDFGVSKAELLRLMWFLVFEELQVLLFSSRNL